MCLTLECNLNIKKINMIIFINEKNHNSNINSTKFGVIA
jgi:hypothetical protein